MIIKAILVIVGLFLLWVIFRRRENPLRQIATGIVGEILRQILRIAFALLLGSVVYFFIVIFGNLDRISTFSDVLKFFQTPPSKNGFPALLGVGMGALFAFWRLHVDPEEPPAPKRVFVDGRKMGTNDAPLPGHPLLAPIRGLVRGAFRLEGFVVLGIRRLLHKFRRK
jgi:hypothetical protein